MSSHPPTLFITGNRSGLGHGITEAFLEHGWRVYGCSRSGCQGLEPDVYERLMARLSNPTDGRD